MLLYHESSKMGGWWRVARWKMGVAGWERDRLPCILLFTTTCAEMNQITRKWLESTLSVKVREGTIDDEKQIQVMQLQTRTLELAAQIAVIKVELPQLLQSLLEFRLKRNKLIISCRN